MVVTQADREKALKVIEEYNGKLDTFVNVKLQDAFDCTYRRIEYILRDLHKKNLIVFRNYRIYATGDN